MSDLSNFFLAWAIYIIASVLFVGVFWRITAFKNHILSSYCLRAVALAIIATPWYVNDQDNLLAPALMVVLMDAITIGGSAAVRAFVPLFLSIMLSIVVVFIAFLIRKGFKAKPRESLQSSK